MKNTILLLNIILLVLLTSCSKYAEPETFLIPDNYTGVIVIVFEQNDGEDKLYKGEKRIYEIPKNGILYTKFTRPEGVLSQEFYYKSNQLRKIEPILLEEEPLSSSSYILDEYGGQNSLISKGGISKGQSTDYPTLKWMYFTIGKPSSNREFLRIEADSLIKKIVNNYSYKMNQK